MSDKITVTMTEEVVYSYAYSRDELIELIDLHPDTTTDALAAIVDGDWEKAEHAGLDQEVYDAARERIDEGPLLDSIMEHFSSVPERDWAAEEGTDASA